jgi:ribosomal-protein-alanine N-acetyltransferase
MSTPKLRQPAFHIRPASEHDLLEITEIEQECGLSAWGWDGYYKELTQEKTAFMFVARLEPQRDLSVNLGGFITSRLVADEVHVHNFGVRPALRRLGLGRALLRAALDYGSSRGAVSAWLEVRAGNEAAQAIYLQHGFAITGRRKNYYDHPTEDAVLMSARL